MKWRFVLLTLAWLAFPTLAYSLDTATCEGKRRWQRSIVQNAVHRWFSSDARPDDLIELIQAEHGIVACAAGTAAPLRLHTTTLSPGLELDQLGALLLANELEWSGLIPRPEEGLAGMFFQVVQPAWGGEDLAPPVSRPSAAHRARVGLQAPR
jgi:hypothetical protein